MSTSDKAVASVHGIHAPALARTPVRARREWSALLQMAPSSFGMLSPGRVILQGLELLSNAANTSRYLSVLSQSQGILRDARIPVLVKEHRNGPKRIATSDLKRPQQRWLGQVALELYFTQLFRSDTAVLDLWPSHFGIDHAGDAVWSPRPFYIRWDPSFLQGIRDVYAGFFLGEQPRFDRGLGLLGLDAAGAVLLRHLGEGDQRSVRFSSSRLEATLRALSARRVQLHRNFVGFGLYVAALHDLLESLDRSFDVRNAFVRSYRGA